VTVRRLARSLGTAAILGPVFILLLAPLAVIAIGSLDAGGHSHVAIPPAHIGLASYGTIRPRYWSALGLSLMLGIVSALAASLFGIPASLGLVRGTMPGKSFLLLVLRAPLQIPAVVIGVSFLELYYAVGGLTRWYAQDSFTGLAVAHTFIVTPYVVGTLVSVLQRYDSSIEEAAEILGAGQAAILWQVTLPLLRPGLFAGALFAFATSFSEVPVSIFLSGSHVTTFPVEIFNSLQFDFDPSVLAVSTIVTTISMLTVFAMQRLLGLRTFLKVGAGE
jgi:putative spermidine/putrescine transport system permease protein